MAVPLSSLPPSAPSLPSAASSPPEAAARGGPPLDPASVAADAALRSILERSQPAPARPQGGSDRLLDFACHASGVRTSRCGDVSDAYARMLRCFGRRRFDVYARRSVSPPFGEGSTLAQSHFWLWCESVGLEEVLDDAMRSRMREARVTHRLQKRPSSSQSEGKAREEGTKRVRVPP